jgi:hypothetical protein
MGEGTIDVEPAVVVEGWRDAVIDAVAQLDGDNLTRAAVVQAIIDTTRSFTVPFHAAWAPGWAWAVYSGVCPKCDEEKTIGHGPLCPDCYEVPS